MNEVEYVALAAACDRLLGAFPVRIERIAVKWLHVLSEHPNTLRTYERAVRGLKTRSVGESWFAVARIVRTLGRAIRTTTSSTIAGALPESADLLIISNLVNPDHASNQEDFYFGTLADDLAVRGWSVVTALRNHSRGSERKLSALLRNTAPTSRVLLSRVAPLGLEFAWLRRMSSVAREFRSVASVGRGTFANVAWAASTQAVTEDSVAGLRVHWQVAELVRRLRPRAILLTFEGHAWERLAFHAARSVNPSIKCIGYQHTILFPRQHAISRPLGCRYDPDVLLTIGDLTRGILAERPGLAKVRLETYGSHRRTQALMSRAADDARRCVVIPEGIESECVFLLRFAMACAQRLPSLEFVVRMHPVMPFRFLARRHRELRRFPSNMRLSSSSELAHDFARCRWALYRGSSAVLQALLAGVRPVYVERENELCFDPLYLVSGWRVCLRTPDAFLELVEADEKRPQDEREAEWAPAHTWAERYVVSPRPQVVSELLNGT